MRGLKRSMAMAPRIERVHRKNPDSAGDNRDRQEEKVAAQRQRDGQDKTRDGRQLQIQLVVEFREFRQCVRREVGNHDQGHANENRGIN